MARDYKNAGTRAYKPKRKSSSSPKSRRGRGKGRWAPWIALVIGLGVVVTGVVYFWQPPASTVTSAKTAEAPKPEPKAKPTTTPKPSATPKPVDDAERYDFYSMLPELEVVIPEKELTGGAGASGGKEAPSLYLLQAGSFRRAEDADRMRAEIALLGIESRVEATTKNHDTWHRVRIGPFSDTRQMGKIRNRLLDNGIDVMVLKYKS